MWEQVKLSQLKPVTIPAEADTLQKVIVDFLVLEFKIPVENFNSLNALAVILRTSQLSFKDKIAFRENGFSAGVGRDQMWDRVARILRDAGAQQTKAATILVVRGLSGDVEVRRLAEERTIFYSSQNSPLKGSTLEPGSISLNLETLQIPDKKGACSVIVKPVYRPQTKQGLPVAQERAKAGQLEFDAMAFQLIMSPGDFVFLKPQRYQKQQITLDSLLFTDAAAPAAVKTYLIICRGISE
ncbi:MAG: hypothetical protein ABIG61_13460 [Planctomycetota bacterium]